MFSFLNLKWLSSDRKGYRERGPWDSWDSWGSDEMVMVNGHPSHAWESISWAVQKGPLNQWTSQEAYAKLMPSF